MIGILETTAWRRPSSTIAMMSSIFSNTHVARMFRLNTH